MSRVVLVTGVARYLGARFARQLAADPAVDRVVGIDVTEPAYDLGGCEFVLADLRTPGVTDVVGTSEIDTVVHMNVLATPQDAGGRGPQKEINVIGTMQLLAACQKAATVRHLVVMSSTTVYGASPRDPVLFTEDMAAKTAPRSGYAKDSIEVEGYVRGFARRRPDIGVTTLRFADLVGPTMRTPLTEYLALPVVPVVLGHDPRLQFVHEDDATAALRLATVEQRTGTFNVAGDGMLLLSQAVRRAGRVPLPVPGFASAVLGSWLRRLTVANVASEQAQFLTHGRGVDTTRMRQDLGFFPQYTTAAAFDSFVQERCRGGMLDRDRVGSVERALSSAIGARRSPADG